MPLFDTSPWAYTSKFFDGEEVGVWTSIMRLLSTPFRGIRHLLWRLLGRSGTSAAFLKTRDEENDHTGEEVKQPANADLDSGPQRVAKQQITIPGRWMLEKYPNFPEKALEIPPPQDGVFYYVDKGELVTVGSTGRIERLLSGDIIKCPNPDPDDHGYCCDDIRIEARIYRAIGPHPRVPRMIDWDPESCCLTLEFLENGSLADYMKENRADVTFSQRTRWARQAVDGLAVVHSVGAIHSDVGAKNFLLDANLDLKIADFAGSFFEGSPATVCPPRRSRHRGFDFDTSTIQDDIFALGSLIYLIMTGEQPYEELSSDEVAHRYTCYDFPGLSNVRYGSLIGKCWHGHIVTVQAALDYLASLEETVNSE